MVYFHRYLFAILIVGLVGTVLAADDEKPRSIKGWGKVIDTAGDCSVKGDENRLTIEVPGELTTWVPLPVDCMLPEFSRKSRATFRFRSRSPEISGRARSRLPQPPVSSTGPGC